MMYSNTSPTVSDWRDNGQYFQFRGQHGDRQIFFRDSQPNGDSGLPSLLLIHGFPTASWDWHTLWPALAQRFRLIAPDMLGFGFSDKPRSHQYSIHEQADLHSTLLAHLGIKQCHALVHDYGVSVMQELLARQQEGASNCQFLSACFLNGGLYPEMHRPRLMQTLMLSPIGPALSLLTTKQQFSSSFSAVFGPHSKPNEMALDSFWQLITQKKGQRIFHRLIRYMTDRKQHRERWVNALEQAKIPIRLINGPEDPVSGEHLVKYYRQRITHADTVVLKGIGHYPQIEAPQAVLRHFLEFADRVN